MARPNHCVSFRKKTNRCVALNDGFHAPAVFCRLAPQKPCAIFPIFLDQVPDHPTHNRPDQEHFLISADFLSGRFLVLRLGVFAKDGRLFGLHPSALVTDGRLWALYPMGLGKDDRLLAMHPVAFAKKRSSFATTPGRNEQKWSSCLTHVGCTDKKCHENGFARISHRTSQRERRNACGMSMRKTGWRADRMSLVRSLTL